MSRRSAFHSRSPLDHEPHLDLKGTTGTFGFLNPTRAIFSHGRDGGASTSTAAAAQGLDGEASSGREQEQAAAWQQAPGIAYRWRSRDNRKGRHALLVDPQLPTLTPTPSKVATGAEALVVPERTNTLKAVARGLWRMLAVYPYWDVSWLVAVIFTLGSCVWVVNAFFVWLPLVQPQTEFPGEETTAGGWTAFVGATIFELGSVLLMFEAVNENRAGCFGWAVEHAVRDAEHGARVRIMPAKRGCGHHHANRRNFVGKGATHAPEVRVDGADDDGEVKGVADSSASSSSAAAAAADNGANGAANGTADGNANGTANQGRDNDWDSPAAQTWQWFPSWHDLRTHYVYELGFLACSFQMLGATVFWISGFTAIPQIYALLPTQASINLGYWIPQMVGGSGFVISSTLFMLETQRAWYLPAPATLGWHIGLWNLIGAFGFTLCGALGPAYANSGAQFEASLATFWGSWAFLVGSVIQWYESLDKHPVEALGSALRAEMDHKD